MRALIWVDLQNDFLPGGALAVPQGDEVIPVANRVAARFDLIVATQDWHPQNHASFASNHPGKKIGESIDLGGLSQVLWPDHCVENTRGAELAPGLEVGRITRVFQKGTDPEIDSYSGFYDNGHRKSTGLAEWLRSRGVEELWLLGLATDYCVRATALDAQQEGFRMALVEEGCRGVDLNVGDSKAAIEEMRGKGIRIVGSDAA